MFLLELKVLASAPNITISECLKEPRSYKGKLFLRLSLDENTTNILIFHFLKMNLHFGTSNI